MTFRVHQLQVEKGSAQDKLERFLNRLEGEVLFISPTFRGMGATAKVDFFLIVEKIK